MRRFIAISELLGGLCVLAAQAYTAWRYPGQFASVSLLLGTIFGLLACIAGLLLWHERPLGRSLSILTQALQVLSVTWMPYLRVVALAGLKAHAVLATTGVHLRLGGGGEFVAVPWARDGTLSAVGFAVDVGIGFAPAPLSESTFTVGINMVALYCLAQLLAPRRFPIAQAAA